jgi:hypothetical protein
MKILISYLLVISIFCSCGNDAKEKIIKTFQPVYKIKRVTTKISGNSYGYCEGGIFLNSDSTFTYEYGCKGKPYFEFGRWLRMGDSVQLDPYPGGKNNISYQVSFSNSSYNPKVTFIVLDKINTPIKDFIIQPFNDKPYFTFTEEGIQYTKTGNFFKTFPGECSTDNAGVLKLDKTLADSLDFSKLYALTGKKFTISSQNLPDTIKLIVDINAIALVNFRLKYFKNVKPFKLKYHNNEVVFDTIKLH